MNVRRLGVIVLCLLWSVLPVLAEGLPDHDGEIEVPVQSHLPGGPERFVKVHLRYPGGSLSNVRPSTGIMLSLHNWGGNGFLGAPDPVALVDQLDCIVLGVDYFQSGSEYGNLPYDFGWLQALDVLRALEYVSSALRKMKVPFAEDRIFAVGGSGGGNVSLMANKLAPRTFAAVVDISGMKELSDDVAFNLEGGSNLDARYSQSPEASAFLSADDRELRHLGNPEHLRQMKAMGNEAKIISVHGETDGSCLFSEALEYAKAMKKTGLDFQFVPVDAALLDGGVFKDTGHSLGDRTEILLHVAGEYLRPNGSRSLRRKGPTDFERKETISYPTAGGQWIVDYSQGFPVGHFEPRR
jgi:hypothetical protein